jgi:hypothetical protein
MTDLNILVSEDSPIYMVFATWINDVGEIVGFGVDKKTDEVHAFLAQPASAVPAASMAAAKVLLSAHVRQLLELKVGTGRHRKQPVRAR